MVSAEVSWQNMIQNIQRCFVQDHLAIDSQILLSDTLYIFIYIIIYIDMLNIDIQKAAHLGDSQLVSRNHPGENNHPRENMLVSQNHDH